ncbi:MAG: hypothetical protein H7240_09270 [Glaciimonas sp.]|nr:hypothetical protein [Glaciimonas sp.]
MSDVKSVVVEGQRTHTASIVTYDADDATLDVKFANNDITSGQITARAQFTVWGWDANNDYVADSTGGTIKIRLPETVNSETDITLSDIATITYENGVAQDRTYAYLDGLWNLAEDVTTGLGADDGNEGELAMLDSGKDYFHQLKETRKSKAILCQIQAAAPTVAALVKEALITTAVGTAASQAVEIVKQSNVATTVLIEVDRAAGSRIILNQNTEFAMSTAASGYYVSFKDSWCTRDPRAYMSAVAAPASITVGNNNVQAQTLSVIWTNDKDYKDYNGYTGGNKRDASINGIGKRSAAIDNDIGRFLAAVYYTNYNAFKFTKTVGAGGVKSTWFSSNSNPPHGPETDYIQLNAKIHWRRSP